VSVLAAFWGALFQLAMSPFNWIDQVIEEVGEKVGRMLNEEASRSKTMGELEEETTIEGLTKWYHWWMPADHVERVVAPPPRQRTQPPCSRGKIQESDDSS
jgi:hypothetical protein